MVRINFNNATRDTVFDAPVERVQPFYAALKEFVDLMNCKDSKFTFKMNPGQWKHIFLNNWMFFKFNRVEQDLEQFFSNTACETQNFVSSPRLCSVASPDIKIFILSKLLGNL